MRLPDDNKRRQIISVAGELFANQPYHKVRLDDVAAQAGVGKGTLYVYFQSKEELYYTIIFEGLGQLLNQLRNHLTSTPAGAMQQLRIIVDELVNYAFQHPQFFELMKTIGFPASAERQQWDARRDDMFLLIEQTLRDGVSSGEFRDPHPELTARFIPGMVRSAMLFARQSIDPPTLKQQICDLLEKGLSAGGATKLSV